MHHARPRTRPVARMVLPVLIAVATIAGLTLASSSAQAVTTTRIKLKVTGCEGCRLTAINDYRPSAGSWGPKKVVGGVAVFTIPKTATKGLTLFIDNSAPNAYGGARTLVVMRYKGLIKGDPVPGYRAKNGHYATQCWAGTTRDKVVLPMTVKHFATTQVNGDPADGIRAYFNPTVASIGSPWATWNGVLYAQSTMDCSGKATVF